MPHCAQDCGLQEAAFNIRILGQRSKSICYPWCCLPLKGLCDAFATRVLKGDRTQVGRAIRCLVRLSKPRNPGVRPSVGVMTCSG